jgi:hypothetical protein
VKRKELHDREPEETNEGPAAKKTKVCLFLWRLGRIYSLERQSQVPAVSKILPGNIAKANQIAILRERWSCSTACGSRSDHCYISADQPHHFPLSMSHFDVWASALVRFLSLHFDGYLSNCVQLKQDGTATLECPPNHKLFDGVSDTSLGLKSPLLLRRLQGQSKENTSPQINLPDNLLSLFKNRASAESLPAPTPATATTSCPALVTMLLPNGHTHGPTLTIDEFCNIYTLSDGICARLKDNGYARMHTFKYIEVSELQAMRFKFGEIAELKEAVRLWAVQAD